METIEISSIKELHELVNPKLQRQWIFRGQADSEWILESSLHRVFQNRNAIYESVGGAGQTFDPLQTEKSMFEHFKANAHIYLDHLPAKEDELSWLSLMQHHGAPTRLLDFTFSPYVALFFALDSGNRDAAIYCLNIENVRCENLSKSVLLSPSEAKVFAFEPKFSNERLMAQQGLFLGISDLNYSHEELIARSGTGAMKIVIPYKLRLIAIKRLQQMNITSSQIYPGLDGFCKSFNKFPMLHRDRGAPYTYDL